MSTLGAELLLDNICKSYGDVQALNGINLKIQPGEFVTLLGPSGSGKTTALLLIAGFLEPTAGRIYMDGESVERKPPHRRNIGMVFQNYALFPHMSVEENIAFPLRMRGFPRRDVGEKVSALLDLVGLPDHGKRRVHQLSGGQQQRVALARALVYNPPLLLMDEPLGALDRKLREQLQLEIKHIQKASNTTVVYVTHDQEEALVMSDRMGIMSSGRLIQVGPPREIYEAPNTAFVADFLGESNLLEAHMEEGDREKGVACLQGGILVRGRAPSLLPRGSRITVAFRPEKACLIGAGERYDNECPGILEELIFVGDALKYMVRLEGGGQVMVKSPNSKDAWWFETGQEVRVGWGEADTILLA
jgi:spermidine/putrescine ABC transporter ATP-binding subunit